MPNSTDGGAIESAIGEVFGADIDLPKESLYEIYVQRHRHCSKCSVVVNKNVLFCHECGVKLPETT